VKKGSRVIGRALEDVDWWQDYGVVAIGVEFGKGRRKEGPDGGPDGTPGSVLLAANDLVIFSARESRPVSVRVWLAQGRGSRGE
jgi:hypothetical protein